jgi:hypothetical protein
MGIPTSFIWNTILFDGAFKNGDDAIFEIMSGQTLNPSV